MYAFDILDYRGGFIAEVVADLEKKTVKVKSNPKYKGNKPVCLFGIWGEVADEDITFGDFEFFISDRCFPRERDNCEELLMLIGIPTYDIWEICRFNGGVASHDYFHFKFKECNEPETP